MLGLGLLLLVVGLGLIVPPGRAPGPSAHRIVRLNEMNLDRTPGHQPSPPRGWKRRLVVVPVAVGLIALGLWFLSMGLPWSR